LGHQTLDQQVAADFGDVRMGTHVGIVPALHCYPACIE
jgi:hypothetical protein